MKLIRNICIAYLLMCGQWSKAQINCDYTLEEIYCLDYVQNFFDGVVAYSFTSTDFQDLRIFNALDTEGNQVIYLEIYTQTNQFSFGESWEVYDCVGNLIELCESTGLAITCEVGEPEIVTDELIYSANANGDVSFPSCANCEDGEQNGQETGVDCGGPDCPPCVSGCTDPEANNYNAMASQDDGSCAYCCDGAQNGTETGVDCGGPVCAPCNYTLTCDITTNSFMVSTIPFEINVEGLLGIEGACNISLDLETSTRTYEIDCSDFGTQSTKLDSLLLYDMVTEDSCYVRYNITKAGNLCNCSQDDYSALMDLYHATDGDQWRFNAGWASGALGNSCIPCDWYGIVCNNDNRVIAINLDTNFMEGIIPSTISQIDDLVLLDLNGNRLTGNIPNEVSQLNDLEFLVLNNNQIGGSIPQSLSSLTKLKRIVFSDNEFEGEIPNNLNNLDDLEWLMLSGNNLTGSIPSNLNQLDNLIVLWLSSNQLTGSIPTEIMEIGNLINLFLHDNNLTGEIPDNIGALTNIEKLLLNDNNLEGCYPTSLDNLCGIGESQDQTQNGYNFNGNNLLPFNGDYSRICNGEEQEGAFCGIQQDSIINMNCMCIGNDPISPCSMDSDSILCYSWLNTILTNTGGCIDPGSSAFIYKVYTTTHDGSPAVLVDNNINCINPSIFGAGFTLYTCEGVEIASCTYAGFNDCNNPPDDHPILGPAFNNGTLIYDSELNVLPDCDVQLPFITTWKTDNSGSSCSSCITIPTEGGGYNYDVDWDNDGVYDELGLSGNVTHDYGSSGIYTVAIRGDFPRIYFNESSIDSTSKDNFKLVNIDQWGDIVWSSMESAFSGCKYLESDASDTPNLSIVTNYRNCFKSCFNFNGQLNNWDVSSATNMNEMFSGAIEFNEEISNWDVSNVTNMRAMFSIAGNFNRDISSWDVSNVSDMGFMFANAQNFNQDLNNWNVSNVLTMETMFGGASSFNGEIGDWEVDNVTTMEGMFQNASNFNQNISNWDVSNVTSMERMFRLAISFNNDISSWDISNVANLGAMLSNASDFNFDLGAWDLNSVIEFSWGSSDEGIFDNCGLDCENYSSTIIGWANNSNTPDNLDLGAENLEYGTNAISARDILFTKGWTFNGDIQGSCGMVDPCSMDTDSILCYSWLNDILTSNFCTDPGPTAYKVYNTFHNGSPAILVDSYTNCNNPATLGAGFTLYTCTGIEIASCTYEGFSDCDNPPNDNPILGPALSNGTLIYNSEVSVLPDCDSQIPFVTTWKTDNSGTSCTTCITIPTTGGGYNYDVDWDNDGVYDELGLTNEVTHDFGNVGTYTIAIRGEFPRIFFSNTGDKDKIINIVQWGDIEWSSMARAFQGCSNLESNAIDAPVLSTVTSMELMFNDASIFNSNINSWDVSNITFMNRCFDGASSFNGDISSWQVDAVVNMSQMFKDAVSFNSDISSWNVESVTDMFSMFRNAVSFNSDISNWNIQNNSSTQRMFEDASSFTSDINGWNVSNVLTMSNMFKNATSFNNKLDLWNFNTQVELTGLFNDSGMDCENYSSTLIGWEANTNTPDNITLGAINIEYGANAIPARDMLISRGWSFNGDSQGSCGIPCPDDEVFTAMTICQDSLANISLVEFESQNPNGDNVNGWLGSINLIFGENIFVVEVSPDCSYTQSVTIIEDSQENCIDPCPEIVWINVPDDITIDYSDLSSIEYSLSYENGGVAACEFSGTIIADTTITDNGCDKQILLEWSATENQISIDTNQIITITDIPAPVWINPPMDTEISCDDIPSIEDRLEYSNGLDDFCEISGVIQATVDVDTSICSEDRILTWNFDGGICFSELIHSQSIRVIGCNDFSLNDDFLSAMTKEDISFNLLDNDIDLIPNVDYKISIIDLGNDLLIDTILTQDGLFSFRLDDSFFDTIKVRYQLCDIDCNLCEEATFFITDEIFEDITPTNYISPNEDGQNDQLRFTREDVMDDTELWVFNRWGDQIYHKVNYTNDWDASGIPSGVYYYVLRVRDIEIKRTLTILK